MNSFWWDSLFWMAALAALAVTGLLLLPSSRGRLLDGRISASSLAIIFYFVYAIPFAFDYLLGIIGPDDLSVQTITMMKVSFIGLTGLVAGIVVARAIVHPRQVVKPIPFHPSHLRRFLWIGIALLVLGWILAYVAAKPFGGLVAFLGAPYHQRWQMLARGFTLWNYAVLVMMAAGQMGGFLLAGYLHLKRKLRGKLIPLLISAAVLLLPALWFILWGQRRGVVVGILVFLVFFSCFVRRIRFRYTVLALASLYALLIFIALVRAMTITTYSPGYAQKLLQEAAQRGRLFGLSRNDPGLTLQPVANIYDYQNDGGGLLLGRSYAAAIAIALPKPLRFTGERPENVAQWYTTKFEPGHRTRGGVVAVTSTAESLANFGLAGVFLIHLLIMFAFVAFELRVSPGILGTVLRIAAIPFFVLILHHSSDINLYKLSYILGILLTFTFIAYGPGLLSRVGVTRPNKRGRPQSPATQPAPAE